MLGDRGFVYPVAQGWPEFLQEGIYCVLGGTQDARDGRSLKIHGKKLLVLCYFSLIFGIVLKKKLSKRQMKVS